MQFILFDWSNNTNAVNVKKDRFVLELKSFEMLGMSFSSKFD